MSGASRASPPSPVSTAGSYPVPADTRYVERFGLDCWCRVGDLSRIFRPTVDAFPAEAPFKPDPERVAAWRMAHDGSPGRHIGIAWRSKAGRDRGEGMYPDIADLTALLDIEDVQLVNLQYDKPEPTFFGSKRSPAIA